MAVSLLFAAKWLVSLPETDHITSLATYFPALTIFLVSAGRGILRLDILPNISPRDHCLKLNPGTAPP